MFDLVATITILTIAGSVGAPLASRYIAAMRLRAAAWSLASDLQRARQKAIAENRSQRLAVSTSDLDPATGRPLSYAIAPAATGSPAEVRAFGAGIFCQSPAGTFAEFNSRGLAGSAVTFTLGSTHGHSLAVQVRATGKVDFPG